MRIAKLAGLTVIAGAIAACGGTARNMATYRADTQQLLTSRDDQIQQCYDGALQGDATLAGTVTVKFTVAKKTGAITNASVDPTQTTAPKALSDCVLQAIDGLVLSPPDKNEGQATFTFDFKATQAAPAAPAEAPAG